MLPVAVGLAAAVGGYRTYLRHAKKLSRLENAVRHTSVIKSTLEQLQAHTNKIHPRRLYEEYLKPLGVPEHTFKSVFYEEHSAKQPLEVGKLLQKANHKHELSQKIFEATKKDLGNPHLAGLKAAFKWGATTAVAGGIVKGVQSILNSPVQPAYVSPDYQEELNTLMKFV